MASKTELRTNENALLRPEFKKLNDFLITSIGEMEKEFKANIEWFEELTVKMQAAKSLARNKFAVLQSKGSKTVRKKTRGQKQDLVHTTNLFEDTSTMNNTSVSTRSRRAAAHNASERMKQINIPMNKKLRRPTNFDELSKTLKRVQTDVFQPPSKCSRITSNQSAGSNSLSAEDLHNNERKESTSSKMEADSTSSPIQLPKENLSPYVALTCCNKKMPNLKNTVFGNEADIQANTDKISTSTVSKSKDTSVIERKNNFETKTKSPSSNKVDCVVKGLDETYKADFQKTDLNFKHPVVCDSDTNNCVITENESALRSEEPSSDEKSEFRTRGRFAKKKATETINIVDNEVTVSENTENPRTRTKVLKKKCEDADILENANAEAEIKESVEPKTKTKVIRRKQENLDNVDNINTKHELKETGDHKTRTKIIKNKQEECETENVDSNSEIKEVAQSTITKVPTEKEDERLDNVNNVDINSTVETTCEPRTRTKVIKKKQEDTIGVVSTEIHAEADGIKNHLGKTGIKNEKDTDKGVEIKILNKEDCFIDTTETTENTKTDSQPINENDFKKPVNENEHSDQTYTKTYITKHDCQSRTKTIKKNTDIQQSPKPSDETIFDDKRLMSPTSNELVKKRVEEYEKLQEESKRNEDCGRVTRTKTRAMAKEEAKAKEEHADNKQTSDLVKENTNAKMKVVQKKKEGKENIDSSAYSKIVEVHSALMTAEKYKATPLSNCNRLGTPGGDSAKKFVFTESHVEIVQKGIIVRPTDDGQQKKKEEMLRRLKKGDQARKNKEITLKATAEETRRKREERLQKAAATREEYARMKANLAAQAEKEREEKQRALAAEKEKQKEEQAKKKLAAQLKAQEIEERRKQEEAARLAKIREQEEEYRRLEAIRQRELDAAEQLHQKRLAEELRAQEAEKNKEKAKQVKQVLKQKQQQQQVGKTNAKLGKTVANNANNTYNITPARNERSLMQPKNENDYGLDHAVSGDDESSEDEENPKKIIPKWAQGANRARPLRLLSHLPTESWDVFMTCDTTVDLSELFGSKKSQRMRTSSQYWGTPPNINSCA